tara:strand:+ start:187 stop:1011 length:825 start_codon:yes stop_codon:yes gene_type:complete
MIKLKTILTEGFAWERKEGKGLPTMAEVKAEYDAKQLKETNSNFSEYSDDALTDMKVTLARYQGNESEITDINNELASRKQNQAIADDGDTKKSADFLDLDGDGDTEESMKSAVADSTNYGNYINKARAKSAVSKNVDRVYGHDASGATKLYSPSDVDNYSIWTIKSKPKSDSVNAGFNSATIGKNYPDEISGEYEGNPVFTPGADLYELLKDILERAIDENDFVDKVADALTDETSNLPHTDEDNLRTWYEKNIGEGFISRLKKNLIGAELRK